MTTVLQLWRIALLGTLAGLLASTASAEVVFGERVAINGTVSYVDENSVMHLEDVLLDRLYPKADHYAVKNWALTISPKALGLIVTGRQVQCGFTYQADAYIVGHCAVREVWADGLSVFPPLTKITSIAAEFGLGEVGCTSDDLAAADRSDERDLRLKRCEDIEEYVELLMSEP